MSRIWFKPAKPSKPGRRPGSVNGGEYVVGWRGRITRDVGHIDGIGTYDEILKRCTRLDADHPDREHYPKPADSIQ
jgi:hypothetical protein